ncbi:hypothetical protein [Halobacteriovorax sp. CON-3]|uniref:hypothetical protein n=1 Tax=Halobacteriovorax sp. CON-3 TaxID=3157710 RepID=UPI00371D834C
MLKIKIILIAFFLSAVNTFARNILVFDKETRLKDLNSCNSIDGSIYAGYVQPEQSCFSNIDFEFHLKSRFETLPVEVFNLYFLNLFAQNDNDKIIKILSVKNDFILDQFSIALAHYFNNKEVFEYLKASGDRYSKFTHNFFIGNYEYENKSNKHESFSVEQLNILLNIKYGAVKRIYDVNGNIIFDNSSILDSYINDLMFYIKIFGNSERVLFLLRNFNCNCSLKSISDDLNTLLKSKNINLNFKISVDGDSLLEFILNENPFLIKEIPDIDYNKALLEVNSKGSTLVERLLQEGVSFDDLRKHFLPKDVNLKTLIINNKRLLLVDYLWQKGKYSDVISITEGDYVVTSIPAIIDLNQVRKAIYKIKSSIKYMYNDNVDLNTIKNISSVHTEIVFYLTLLDIVKNSKQDKFLVKEANELIESLTMFSKKLKSYIDNSALFKFDNNNVVKLPFYKVTYPKVKDIIIKSHEEINIHKNIYVSIEKNVEQKDTIKYACIDSDFKLSGVFDIHSIKTSERDLTRWGEDVTRFDEIFYGKVSGERRPESYECSATLDATGKKDFKLPFVKYDLNVNWNSILPRSDREYKELLKTGLVTIQKINDKYSMLTDFKNYYVSDQQGNILKFAKFDCATSDFDRKYYCSHPNIVFIGDLNGDSLIDIVVKDGAKSSLTYGTLEFYLSQENDAYKFMYIGWPAC